MSELPEFFDINTNMLINERKNEVNVKNR